MPKITRRLLVLRHAGLAGVLLLLTLGVAACNRLPLGTPNFGHSVAFNNDAPVFVVCSLLCEQRGHCGTVVSDGQQQRIVMLSPNAPSTLSFNALLSENQPVTVRESRTERMVLTGNGQQFDMRFYRIESRDVTPVVGGWLPGFCVADSPLNR